MCVTGANLLKRSADGQPVTYSDPEVTAWYPTEVVCCLFGWRLACVFLIQIDRCVHPDGSVA